MQIDCKRILLDLKLLTLLHGKHTKYVHYLVLTWCFCYNFLLSVNIAFADTLFLKCCRHALSNFRVF